MNTVEISCTDENTTPPVIAALTATKDDAIIKFEKGNKKYTKWDYLLGPKAKKEKKYLEFLYQKYDKISKKLPNKYIFKKFKLFIIKTKIKKILNSK